MLLVLAGSSIIMMEQRETQRAEQRTALLAKEPSPTDLALIERGDVWRGEQYPVVWIEQAGDTKPVLPPGMERFPKPGQAVVSPKLDQLAANHPDLDARYPDRLVLGSEGLYSGEELFAYVRMPTDRTLLPANLAGDPTNKEAIRVQGFRAPDGAKAVQSVAPLYHMGVPLSVTVVGVMGMLLVPGLALLVCGILAGSSAGYNGLETPSETASQRWSSVVSSASNTVILALPGLAASVLLWGTVSPRLEQVPLIDYEVASGDLRLPWWVLLAEFGIGFTAVVLITISTVIVRRTHRTSEVQPPYNQVVVSLLRSYAILIPITLLIFSWHFDVPLRSSLPLAGAVFIVALMPLLMREVGLALCRFESVSTSTIGEELELRPHRVMRPFIPVALLLCTAFSCIGYVAIVDHANARQVSADSLPSVKTQAVFVDWIDPSGKDPAHLKAALNRGLVAPVSQGVDSQEDSMIIGAKCTRIASYISGTECDLENPYKLLDTTEARLSDVLAPALPRPDAPVSLASGARIMDSGSALVLGDTSSLEALESHTRVAAMQTLPVPHVYSALSGIKRPIWSISWIVHGMRVALITLAVGYLILLVSSYLNSRMRSRLLNEGATTRRRSLTQGMWTFLVPYGIATAVGSVTGLVICIVSVNLNGASIPWANIGTVLGAATVIGLLVAASLGSFVPRDITQDSRE